MKKRMIIMLIVVGVLFGLIFIWKGIATYMMNQFMASSQTTVVNVSAIKAVKSAWQPKVRAAASLRAIRGVNVTTQLAGMITHIYFTPGSYVESGTVLVQLNADSDIALLHSLQAQAELAKITLERDKKQYAVQAISKATLDTSVANLQSLRAQVEEQAATVAKKTIVAPFSGRLGISAVNPGQFLNTGDKVVSLQTLDPIWADFFVPQQNLVDLKVGQSVHLTTDAFPNKVFKGKITTIDPAVDVSTRNVQVEATIENPHHEITPGMFATVDVLISTLRYYLTLPQTAISFNPYGQLAYIVKQQGKDKKGDPILIASQVFVTTGEMRGDQIAVLSGIKEGDLVVTSGQLKLKNGSQVAINNKIMPDNNPAPQLPNDH